MPKINFRMPDGETITIEARPTLYPMSVMELGSENNVPGIVGECGGLMACATCHVYVAEEWAEKAGAPKDAGEEDLLTMVDDRRETSRLGCQLLLTPELDGLVVTPADA